MSSIIQVENVSKSYTISHEGREKYTALREVMAKKAKKIFSFPKLLSIPGNAKITREVFWSLNNVSFQIEKGERIGIIGRNGAGKSTLLKILSRIIEPTSGTIKIKGRVASLLEVGTGFHPELTGRENIFLNGAILGMTRAEIKRHFDAIVDFAEIEKFLDTPVKRYSSGMYVKLAFAVAAHLEPEILIVDEVLAVGDAQFQKKCLSKMGDVSKDEGRTVILVSHNMGAIKQLCQNAILLDKGEIKLQGEVSEVVESYNNSNLSPDISAFTTVWVNDDDSNKDSIVVNRIEVKNASGAIFLIDNPTQVEIKFTCNEDIDDIVVGLNILNTDEVPILRLNYNDFDNNYEWKTGQYTVLFELPAYTFANGNYILECDIAIPHTKSFTTNKMRIYFNMHPKGKNGDAYFVRFNSNYNSIIRPVPKYKITREGI